MHAEHPDHEDDLNAVERRLAGWRPAGRGLDADAMLFAAGQAAARRGRGRLLWPALCALLAVQVAALSAWGLAERSECRTLASRLRERAPAPDVPPPAPVVQAAPEPSYTPSPDDYFHLLRRVEQDPNGWLASTEPTGPPALGPPAPEPPVLKAGQRDLRLTP